MKKKTAFKKWLDDPINSWADHDCVLKNAKMLSDVVSPGEKIIQCWVDSNGLTYCIDVFPCGTAVTYYAD
jgi:hypothetical protein